MTKRKQFAHIEAMRGRMGLKKDDPSRDEEIARMTPQERLALIAGWHLGYSGWDHTIMNWVRDAGFKVRE